MKKTMTVLSAGRGTWAGREVQTDKFPVVNVPESIKIGDAIIAEYRVTPRYGLWFFAARMRGGGEEEGK